MTTRPTPSQVCSPARPGYSLMEVLVAIAILAIGLTTVAAIFPSALIVQKQAVDDTLRQQHVRSAEAVLQGKQLSANTLLNFTDYYLSLPGSKDPSSNRAYLIWPLAAVDDDITNTGTTPNPPTVPFAAPDPNIAVGSIDTTDSFLNQFSEFDRSYPSYIPDLAERDVFWVPFIQRGVEANAAINDWRVIVFILERGSGNLDDEAFDIDHTTDSIFDADAAVIEGDPGYLNGLPANSICANPSDDAAFPKVFGLEGSLSGDVFSTDTGSGFFNTMPDANGNNVIMLRPGDIVLGNDGVVYRITELDGDNPTSAFVVKEVTRFSDGRNSRTLTGIWYGRPSVGGEPSPTRDIRLLSNDVTKLSLSF